MSKRQPGLRWGVDRWLLPATGHPGGIRGGVPHPPSHPWWARPVSLTEWASTRARTFCRTMVIGTSQVKGGASGPVPLPQAGLGPATAPHPPALVAQGLARPEEGRRGRNPAQAEEPCTHVPPFLDPPPPAHRRWLGITGGVKGMGAGPHKRIWPYRAKMANGENPLF